MDVVGEDKIRNTVLSPWIRYQISTSIADISRCPWCAIGGAGVEALKDRDSRVMR